MSSTKFPTVAEVRAAKGVHDPEYMVVEINGSLTYWSRKKVANIFDTAWSFDKGTHVVSWYYPRRLGWAGDVWQIMHGSWHINLTTGETDAPNAWDTSEYVRCMLDKSSRKVVKASQFEKVMGYKLPFKYVDILPELDKYLSVIGERRYL